MNDLQIAILELEEKFKTQSCRFCLTPDKQIKYHLISEKLKKCFVYCTGITLNQEDGLPNQICTDCLSSLIISYKFKKICLLTEKICKNLQTNKINVELRDDLSTQAVDDDVYEHQLEEDHVDNNNSIIEEDFNENYVNENQDDEIYVTENQDNDNYGNIDDSYDNHVHDNSSIYDNNDVTYLIYDPGIQDNETNLTEQHKVESHSGLETQASIEGPSERMSDEGNTKVVGRRKRLVFGPFTKRKMQAMKLYCKWCDMKFDTKEEAGVHRQMVHKQSLTCKFCGKSFTRQSAHYLHVKSHLPPTLQCDHCDFRSALKQNMIVHLRTHSVGPRKYQCDKCPSSHHTASNLLNHKRKAHEMVKRFACHICGNTFYTRTALNKHVGTHSDIKPYECPICHAQLARRWNWKHHLLKKHGVTIPPKKRGSRKLNTVVGETSAVYQAEEGQVYYPYQTEQ